MEGTGEHLKFFRFRSPCILDHGGLEYPLTWLIRSFQYIDFSYDVFIQEAFAISYYSRGGFSYRDICELDFLEYEVALKEAMRIRDTLNTNNPGEDNDG